ncbi:bifunctional diaminohydroxyphosphoribosylaminopyrimidine deaminase/5-amino-6-(5-phosphoribosylamino)uracil reductase RibD [Desulfonatronum thioautotrophicum]|uniref:bifunctional diaminohydroxyphosphoribosylaminopyrimidine deaminase/5-amino-6-(5-phosphoribosylamino)uracil reductase RibD n=1 Tax=Desulfonatronum thioautotrophicum TaxID=617001 RepID=UPI0006998EBA|nr:bifunctional diaminohydroxyphosphoribosylaminopyrimidine deaminase/5-amino-6-(5-phosphoribosylamino)uracil reductase RibD [Desulfonatronum thioautotrophicum]
MNSFPLPENADWIMRQAVALAERGKGSTAPNPCVGAVLTREGRIVAQGFHHGPGLPHAEVEVLRDAAAKGVAPSECILWVTLEPCNHTGRTPPCTQAVVHAGIKQVVVGAADPNPRVLGGGIPFLRQQGVQVLVGVAEQACLDLIADFQTWIATSRPYLYLKMAATLDGRIATRSGDSQWITNARSRQMVHHLRGRVGAVIVGAGTFRMDDPRLTCRHRTDHFSTGHESNGKTQESVVQPLAVIVGTKLPDAQEDRFLLRNRAEETLFWTTPAAARGKAADKLRALGARIWGAGTDSLVDLESCLIRLRSELGVMEALCEGGGGLAQNLVSADLIGEWWLFLAPRTLGDTQAVPLLSGADIPRMAEAKRWRTSRIEELEGDLRFVLHPEAASPEEPRTQEKEDGCSPD